MKLSYGRSQDDFRPIFRVSSAILVIIFSILLIRLWHLQILNGQKWFEFSEANRIKLKEIPAVRGRIFDRNQKLIAESKPSYDLLMTPNKTGLQTEEALQVITDLISWDMEAAQQNFIKNRHPNPNRSFILKKNLSRDELAIIKVNQPRLDGFDVQTVPTRTYIYPETANHILGRLGEIDKEALKEMDPNTRNPYEQGDFWGISGVEQKYESELKGIDGVKPVLEDVWGREQDLFSTGELLPDFKEKKATPGSDIFLTIDIDLQLLASELLQGKKGSVVALDPRSGEILAMESKPSYISEYFARGVDRGYWRSLITDPDKPLYNRSLQAVYPPASTFKVITALASLFEMITDPEEIIHCPGYYRIGREVKRCWKRGGHGYVNLVDAIKHSCDVYFYEISKRLGIDNIAKYARLFGLGSKTGIDFARESKGLVPDDQWKRSVYGEPWVGGETLSVGIGQGALLTTPVQMAVLYAAFINEGFLVVPQVLLGVEASDGGVKAGFEREVKEKINLDPKMIAPILSGLDKVVQEKGGTAYWFANSKVVPISGKTGTAQVVSLDAKTQIKDHAWFIGYAPSDDPQIVVATIVEHGEHGSSGASPIVRHIIEKYFEKQEL